MDDRPDNRIKAEIRFIESLPSEKRTLYRENRLKNLRAEIQRRHRTETEVQENKIYAAEFIRPVFAAVNTIPLESTENYFNEAC